MSRYLGPDPESMIARVRARAPGWFSLAEDVAQYCADLLPNIKADPTSGQQVLAAVLFGRVLSAFEAVILLAERGMHTEGMVLRRSMLEGLFVLGAIWQQPDLVTTYVQNDRHRRRDLYKNLKKASREHRRSVTPWISDDELDGEIAKLTQVTRGVRYLSVEQFAQAARLHDLYLTDYSLLSEAAHHVARDLERQITVGDGDQLESILWGPDATPPMKLLFPAIDHMLMSAHVISKVFKLDIESRFGRFSERSRELSESEENVSHS